ncbi:hypothetical protein CBF23_013925 [Marinomonas agarivorans]|nr:hypothetical protein CBF23_013925 [Marinomonas agarivorans]
MLRIAYWLSVFVLTLTAQASFSQTVEASGQAVIYNNDLIDARYRATEQALKQAVLQANAKVVTNDTLINGELNSSSSLTGIGRTQKSNIINEVREGNILTVTLLTEVTADHICSNGSTNLYRKSVGVTGFALQTPQQTNLGAIHSIPRQLPRDLVKIINAQGSLQALAATNIQIYPDLINAPASTNSDGSLTDIAQIGESLGVQYVMAGVIRDLGATNDHNPYKARTFNYFNDVPEEQKDYEIRNIALDVYLYDAFSGALLFEESYQEAGVWDLDRHRKVGYGSSQFWATEFGQSVQQVMHQAALDANTKLKCQPFMANIFRTEGNRVHINAGSVAGIKLGETFKAYRRYEIFNQLQDRTTQLNNANVTITIKQVQPNFSIGELNVDTKLLNLQPQDVVIAW